MTLSKNQHLTNAETIKRGSIYTPEFIVKLCYSMIVKYINHNSVVIDFGAGYGAFIDIFKQSKAKRIIATENDKKAYEILSKNYADVEIKKENSLLNVSRSKYKITNEDIISIGNPPYNDVTSQYKKGEKGGVTMDSELYSRDLGISFLKMYSILKSKYICVLHPLSYISKKANFNSLGEFAKNYTLISGTIFSSREFRGIKKKSIEFPVVAALYVRSQEGMKHEDILNFKFNILNTNNTFRISDYLTIDGYINKYPTKNKADSDLQFYTVRDLNALKRNRSFLTGHCNNGIKVTKDNLHLYAWLDLVKNFFTYSDKYYLFGNLSPIFTKKVIDDKVFQNKLIAYICQNNDVVINYFKKNDPLYLKEWQSYKFDLRDLTDEIITIPKLRR